MFTKNINLKSFRLKRNSKKIRVDLKLFLKENNTVLKSLGLNYKNKYNKKLIKKFNKYSNLRIIGMGGSILGTETIYDFLKHKIKKNFFFINNLKLKNNTFNKKKSYTNLIVSKSRSIPSESKSAYALKICVLGVVLCLTAKRTFEMT